MKIHIVYIPAVTHLRLRRHVDRPAFLAFVYYGGIHQQRPARAVNESTDSGNILFAASSLLAIWLEYYGWLVMTPSLSFGEDAHLYVRNTRRDRKMIRVYRPDFIRDHVDDHSCARIIHVY